ncbi:MAG TPA: GntR family transcriptional regulator [Streptosporangiaceae bacterium]|nr:GntR family transcriptional regulator [Streptosporangiaceae bacterium]
MAEPVRSPGAPRRRPHAVELTGIGPVSTTRRADDVAEQIRNLIISEQITEGSRLPAERELADRFGASRPTVSQALRSLSLMGLVEIRHGSGAYVIRRPEAMVTTSVNLMLDLDTQSVDHLMQLRLWLETIGVEEAATRSPVLGDGEIEDIQGALHRLRDAAGRAGELIAADTVFHATIVRSAGNPYLAAIYESVHSAVLSYQLKAWVDTESVPPWLRGAGPEQQWALHEPIAASVIGRRSAAARAAVLDHHRMMAEHVAAARRAHLSRQ